MKIPLIGNSYPAFSPAISEQASINCYTETVEVPGGDKSKTILRGAPGTMLFKTLTAIDAAATPVRGIWSGGGRCFVVAGTKYFEISSAGALIGSVYTVATDAASSPVQIFANGNQLFIVSAGLTYCDNGGGPVQVVLPTLSGTAHINPANNYQLLWDSGDHFDIGMLGQSITWNGLSYTVSSITNPNLITLATTPTPSGVQAFSATVVMGSSSGTFIDGFFVVSRPASRQFNISAQLDGTSFDPLDFGIKEGYPDNLVAVYAENELLYLFGTETMEAWRNVGSLLGTDFPFQRVDGGFLRIGLVKNSVVSIAGKVFLLGTTRDGSMVAYRLDGATPTRVSTHAQEDSFRTLVAGNIGPAVPVAYSYLEAGHWFWVLSFNGADWVYDVTESGLTGTSVWSQRIFPSGILGTYYQFIPAAIRMRAFHTFIPEWGVAGKHLVGSGGVLYEQSAAIFDENAGDMYVTRILPYVFQDNLRIYHHRIEFEMESGAGNNVVKLDWSDDRGHSWTGGPVILSGTDTGNYTKRYVWRRLGSSRGRVYRLRIQTSYRLAIIDGFLEATIGTA